MQEQMKIQKYCLCAKFSNSTAKYGEWPYTKALIIYVFFCCNKYEKGWGMRLGRGIITQSHVYLIQKGKKKEKHWLMMWVSIINFSSLPPSWPRPTSACCLSKREVTSCFSHLARGVFFYFAWKVPRLLMKHKLQILLRVWYDYLEKFLVNI